VFRDLAADRDGDADVPRRPRRDARARRDPRGGRLRDERTPDRDSRRDPRGRAAAHAPRGESIDERAVGEFAFDAPRRSSAAGAARQSRPKSFPNRTSSTPRSTSSSSEPAGRPTGDRSVPRPPVPDRGGRAAVPEARCWCRARHVRPGSDAARVSEDDRSLPRDRARGHPAHDALLSDSLPIVENLCGLDGGPAGFRLYAFPLRLRGQTGRRCERSRSGRGDRGGRAAARETDQTRFKRRRRIATQGRYPWKCHVVSTRTVPTVTPTRSTKWRRFDRVGRPE